MCFLEKDPQNFLKENLKIQVVRPFNEFQGDTHYPSCFRKMNVFRLFQEISVQFLIVSMSIKNIS